MQRSVFTAGEEYEGGLGRCGAQVSALVVVQESLDVVDGESIAMVEADVWAEVIDRGLVAEKWTVDESTNRGWMDGWMDRWMNGVGILSCAAEEPSASARAQDDAKLH